jgi:hypothetical protein
MTLFRSSFLKSQQRSRYSNSTTLAFAFNGPRADTIYSPRLLKQIWLDEKVAKGEVGCFDWEPLCGCQNPGGLKVNSISVTDTSGITYAKVKIKFQNVMPPNTKIIIVQLKETKDKWLIDDVIDSPWLSRAHDLQSMEQPSDSSFS